MLLWFERNLKRLTPKVMSRLLSYDEAAIRSEASRLWLAAPRTKDLVLVSQILDDIHPKVISGAFKGAIESWHFLPVRRRNLLMSGLVAATDSSAVAAALLPTVIVFNRREEVGIPPWQLFERIVPNILKRLPAGVCFSAFWAISKRSYGSSGFPS
jgi:hypothetical protein